MKTAAEKDTKVMLTLVPWEYRIASQFEYFKRIFALLAAQTNVIVIFRACNGDARGLSTFRSI